LLSTPLSPVWKNLLHPDTDSKEALSIHSLDREGRAGTVTTATDKGAYKP
jgi:hypothetical protein